MAKSLFPRMVVGLAGLAILTIAVIVLLGFIPLRLPSLAERLTQAVNQSVADSCTIESISVTAWRGVEIDNVYFSKSFGNGKAVTVFAEKVELGYKPFAALSRRRALVAVIRKLSGMAGQDVMAILTAGENRELRACVRMVAAKGVAIVTTDRSDTTLAGEAFTGNVVFKAGGRAFGKIQGKRIVFSRLNAYDPEVSIRIKDGKLELRDLHADIYGGKLKADVLLDLDAREVLGGKVAVKNVDLNRLYTDSRNPVGDLSGRANLTLDLQRSPWDPEKTRGVGKVLLTRVRAREVPLLKTIVVSLAVPGMEIMQYKRLEGDLVLKDGAFWCENITGSGEPFDLVFSGRVGVDGWFSLASECTFDASYKKNMTSFAWDAMMPADNGGRLFLCTVRGTFDNPHIRVNKRITRRAMRNAMNTFGSGMRKFFNR